MKLGILASHPIQYQAPWLRELAKETDLDVFFAHRVTAAEQGRAGFGVAFDWDVDLLVGYRHTFLRNVSKHPSVNRFSGCNTPEIAEIIRTGGERSAFRGQSRFDAFIVTGWYLKSYWQAVRACRRAGVPVLVRGDSQLNQSHSALKRAFKQLTHRFALRQFDGFLSVGQRNREYLHHYGAPTEKIFFVPHFVDNERFAAQAAKLRSQRSEIRGQWRIPEDAFCVSFCGKFIPKKRPMDLVKAAQFLITQESTVLSAPLKAGSDRRYSAIHLLFVGSGELGAELRDNCDVVFDGETNQRPEVTGRKSDNRQPLTDNSKPPASFAGFLNQTAVSKAYVAADVLVLPSDGRETWGLVVNEAMASGLPAIVSDAVGCAPDLIEEGKTGFTFSPGDCEQLARRLQKLAEMKQRGHDFGPALASKLQDYSTGAALRGTVEALETVMHSKQR